VRRFFKKDLYRDRHSGAGRNRERSSGACEWSWTPACAGVTKSERVFLYNNQYLEQEGNMKSSTRDQAEGSFHQIKGKVKEIAGKVSDDPALEVEGKAENSAGKVQEKIGEVKAVLGK